MSEEWVHSSYRTWPPWSCVGGRAKLRSPFRKPPRRFIFLPHALSPATRLALLRAPPAACWRYRIKSRPPQNPCSICGSGITRSHGSVHCNSCHFRIRKKCSSPLHFRDYTEQCSCSAWYRSPITPRSPCPLLRLFPHPLTHITILFQNNIKIRLHPRHRNMMQTRNKQNSARSKFQYFP